MKCRGCGAPIVWIKMMGSGKKMPVNEDPVLVMMSQGTDSFIRTDGVVIMGCKIGDAYDDYPDDNVVEAYESHFATCPQANHYRRR